MFNHLFKKINKVKPISPPNTNEALTESQIDRIIEMAWEDRTPFDAITFQFGLADIVKQRHSEK